MSSVGSCLREMRLKRGVSLEEVARSTRITARYLTALESDNFSILPSPVFTRGFIRAYCEALGESSAELLSLYEQRHQPPELPGRLPVRATVDAAPGRGPGRGRSALFVSFFLVVGLGAALLAVTLMLQGGGHEAPAERGREVTTTPAPPVVADPDVRPAASTPPRPPETPATPLPRETAAPSVDRSVSSPYRLVVKTIEPTWLRVRTADRGVTEENIPAGQTREWVSDRPFILTVGNAGGVRLELNGRPLPPLGVRGAVVRDYVLPREQP